MEAPVSERSTLPLQTLLDPAIAAALMADVADLQLLQRISTRLISEDNVQALYEEILDGALAIMRCDIGSMQLLDSVRGELRLIAYRGFQPEIAQMWQTVRADSGFACGESLRRQSRLVVADVHATDLPLAAGSLEVYRRSGVVAVQSTPLVSRAGHVLGMLSTHWRQSHEPPERALRLLDVLARQAADLIERARAEAAVRQSEERFAQFMRHLPGLAWIKSADGRYVFANDAAAAAFGVPLGELAGKTDREIFPPVTAAEFEENDRRALAGGEGIQTIENLEVAAGDVRQSIVSKFPIPSTSGNGEMVGGVAFDITELRRTELALQKSEEQYRTLFESMDEGFCVIRMLYDDQDRPVDYEFLEINPAFVKQTGLESAVGRRVRDLAPTHEEHWFEIYGQIAKTGEAKRFQNRAQALDRWFDVYAFRVGAPEERKVAVVFTDITDRKRAEDRLDLVIHSSQIGLWYCDLPFGRLDWNAQVKEQFGLPADADVTIDTFFERLHADDRQRTDEAIQRSIRDGSPFDMEYRTIGLDGRERWIRSIGQVAYDAGRPARFDGITIDVTERVRQAEELREADRKKDEFLATLAHELRNPLAPIRNSLNLLGLSGERDPAARQIHEIMERQVNHMIRLVDDLLEMSRITRNKVELQREPVELAAILRTAVEISQPLIDASRHQLAIALPPEPLTLDADAVRLGQVFANLLNNAAKYTPSGGQIWLSARQEGSEVVVSVRDSGQGIESEMLQQVFDLFTQVDRSPSRHQGGLGIGLTLVKSLVESHGGSVVATSPGLNQGSEFTVRLPLAANQRTAAGKPAARASAGALASRRLLVVDDNRDAANSLGRLLRVLGAEVQIAHSGAEALELLEKFRPVTVLLDIGMPGMDGYEVAQRVRERFDASQVVLIALTGWGQEEDRRRSQAAGFDHHLVKPVDHGVLLTLLAG